MKFNYKAQLKVTVDQSAVQLQQKKTKVSWQQSYSI